MEGVTTAIVAFIFVCVVYPHLVKNKPQFYGAFAAILLVILIQSVMAMVGEHGRGVAIALTGLLQIAAILLMYMSCGGVTLADLTSEFGKTIEVVRRGGEKETIIVPLRGEKPRGKDED
jgi:hypothetical protein